MPRTRVNVRLRMAAFRTFCGAVCTLVSSIVYGSLHPVKTLANHRCSNLSVLMALNGELGWVCLMCCNCDSLLLPRLLRSVALTDSLLHSDSPLFGNCDPMGHIKGQRRDHEQQLLWGNSTIARFRPWDQPHIHSKRAPRDAAIHSRRHLDRANQASITGNRRC